MHNNQKLLLTGLIAFGAAFGAWYAMQGPDEVDASGPVSPRAQAQQDRETRRDRQLSLEFEEVPEGLKKVEKGLADRWDHLGEEVLTAASVDSDGELLYFDKEIIVGRDGSGNPIYAQGAHRAFIMEGPVIRETRRQPVRATIKPDKVPGSGFLFEALRNGAQQQRGSDNAPAPKSPATGG